MTMPELEQVKQAQTGEAGEAAEASGFASLLQKQFKPQSERARE